MPEVPDESDATFRRRPRSAQSTIFFIVAVLVVGMLYSISRSIVGTPPRYDAGPLPEVQERWELLIPVDTTAVTAEGADGESTGTTVWHLRYEGIPADELLRSTTGPGAGAPLTSPLADCEAVDLYLEAAGSSLDCAADFRGIESAHARSGSDVLWVLWADGAIYLIQYLD